jgi:hypothetical protein
MNLIDLSDPTIDEWGHFSQDCGGHRYRAYARHKMARLWTTVSIGNDKLARLREWLGGPEATSKLKRGERLTGKAFATRVRRIPDHLNDKISHITCESTILC